MTVKWKECMKRGSKITQNKFKVLTDTQENPQKMKLLQDNQYGWKNFITQPLFELRFDESVVLVKNIKIIMF